MRRYILIALALTAGGCAETNDAWHHTTHEMKGYASYSEPTIEAKLERMTAAQSPEARYADTVFGMYSSPKINETEGVEIAPVRPPKRLVRREVTEYRQAGGSPVYSGVPNDTAGGEGYAGGNVGGGRYATGATAVVDDVQINSLDGPVPLTP
jgi:hypothetical protein